MTLAGEAWSTPVPNQPQGNTPPLLDLVELVAAASIANGVLLEPFPRRSIDLAAGVIGATGQLYEVAVAGIQGQTIGHLGFLTGTTAASTPTNCWLVLCDRLNNGLAWTADQTTTAIAASTAYSLALASVNNNPLAPASGSVVAGTSLILPYTGLYYIGILVAGTTIPTLSNTLTTAAAAGLAPKLNGTATTPGAVGPPTVPTNYGALTALVGMGYLVAAA